MKYIFDFPILFKREGAYMLATLLSSEKARETTKNIIETFVGVCEITEKHGLIQKSNLAFGSAVKSGKKRVKTSQKSIKNATIHS